MTHIEAVRRQMVKHNVHRETMSAGISVVMTDTGLPDIIVRNI